jgi:glycosyltransferase involved in cell wall biosynthesis
MQAPADVRVAVLLATCNGAPYIGQQLESLTQNVTRFTLHWLDDHSTDHTRTLVRERALSLGVELKEWHQPERQRLPGAFFQLLESADADIYFFCDQDDIWQAGKIDTAVAELAPDLGSAVLGFSDSLMFYDDAPEVVRRVSEVFGSSPRDAMEESRVFMTVIAPGHTQCFTRPLREVYLAHKDIARTYARNHDAWMYLIATAVGTVRMLADIPTALYRQHDANVTAGLLRGGRRLDRRALTWKQYQALRPRVARHAEGFLLAAPTLAPSHRLERLVALAGRVARLDRRQSAAELLKLAGAGALWPNRRWALGFAAACLWSDAVASKVVPTMV